MTELMKKISRQDIRNTMAMTWMALSFLFLFKLLYIIIPESNRDIVMIVVGIVVGKLNDIMGYFFGQSKSEIDQQKKSTP